MPPSDPKNPAASGPEPSAPQWHIGPAIAAWAVPGLGHFLLGERLRGAILFVSIFGLWLGGLLLGGISVIDRTEHSAWYLGQMLVAPSVATNFIHQRLKPSGLIPTPGTTPPPPYVPSYGRPSEQGVLYTALAGLLNLLAIMDVVYVDPSQRRRDTGIKPDHFIVPPAVQVARAIERGQKSSKEAGA